MFKNIQRKVACLAVLAVSIGCSSPTIKEINDTAVAIAKEARDLKAEGKHEEAIRLISVIEDLHPNDPLLQEIRNGASAEQIEAVTPSKLLGYNKGIRAKVTASTGEKIAWYIPDRIFDFIDQVEFWFSIGPQIGVGGHVTRAIQAELYTGATVAAGYGQKKMIGFRSEVTTEIGLGPLVLAGVFGGKAGTGGIAYNAEALWLHLPSEAIYQNYRDYWGIGAHAGVVFWGVEGEYHPIEIYDFLGGLFLYDPMNDDFATTRRLKYTSRQSGLIRSFSKNVGSLEKEDFDMYAKDYPKIVIPGTTPAPEVIPAPAPKKR
ncbi:hypothetical protein EHQ58_15175 [Leptospira ognonensis]|uniref:Lipoprotein n=1 Tax=Leptospira ognonensis TaxID=2484945 RepID=A0A4R9JX83_9LEPT|nr:hypothetical protein [Leptospira ognonensis]TGL57127.1 hypothetical protein EHQ58_15175 [Leptospira ognonensis]